MGCLISGPCEPFIDELGLCCLVSGALGDPCLTNGTPVSQLIIDNALMAASEVLWASTGRQFGTCTVTIRPCKKSGCNPCPDGGELPFFGASDFGYGFGYPWYPIHTANGWINVSCPCSGSCGCNSLCEITLPYPVCSVDEVVVDGVILEPELYRVDDFKTLVRLEFDSGLSNTKFAYGPPTPAPTATGGTFELDLSFGGLTGPIPWDATQADLQLIFDTNLGVGNSVVVLFDSGLGAFNSGFTIELIGDFAGLDFPGFIVSSDTTLITGPDSPYASPNAQFTIGGEVILIPNSGACWPECQDLSLPDTEVGTFSITVTYGRPVPTIVKMATAALACEFIKSCVGQPCQLPQRVQNITRQGVSVGFLDPMEFIDQGLTGIYIVDMAIKRYNPKNLLKQASVFSPDTGRRWRRVGT